MMNAGQNTKDEKRTGIGLAVFFVYVITLIFAAVSELFDFGWFDHPFFK